MLSHEISRTHGAEGLPDGSIDLTFTGSAGNSLGAFLASGVTLRVDGDANDYVGKGLSGGRIVVRPAPDAAPDFVAENNIIAGNVICYGATAGEVFLRGIVGERFCVRNSGDLTDIEELTADDVEFLHGIIQRHVDETGSARGRELLGGWAQNVNHFAKVMPRDYKRVLLAIEQATKDGRNVDEAIMEAANG